MSGSKQTVDQSKNIKDRLRWAVSLWKNSRLFHWIDQQISKHFRKKLKNDRFTILCSNCIGGVIYHRLGKQFLSPTVNMFFSQPDFVAFCLHLDHYLGQELCFLQTERPHPVAILPGDGKDIPNITLYFNHDREPEEAREKWNARKQRIVRDNLYIILYNLDGVTIEQLKKLETVPCRNKVLLTCRPVPEIPWSVYIKPIESHRYAYSYLEKDIFGVRYYEKKFDFVSFLNQ